MNKILKKIWMSAAVLIILMAVLSSVFRSLTPWAKEYKQDIEQHLTILLGQPVHIQTMETGWYWFHPVLKLNDITLGEPKPSFHIRQLLVGINLFRSLWNWKIEPGVLYLDSMHLTVREKKGHWSVDGISMDAVSQNASSSETTQQILAWLSIQERIIVKQVSASIYLSNGRVIPVNWVNVSIANSNGHYKLKGNASLEKTNHTNFQLLGDGYFDPEHLGEIEGKFYFAAQNVMPFQWKNLFPKAMERFDGGKGDLKLWVDVRRGAIVSAQAHVQIKDLAWRMQGIKKIQLIPSFFANLSWEPEKKGWQLRGDKVQLQIGKVQWPENQFSLQYNRTRNSYQLYLKTVLLDSLFSGALQWPKELDPVLKLNPEGTLQDAQVLVQLPSPYFKIPSIKEKKIAPYEILYVLTRFEKLSWKEAPQYHLPSVKNISGVLHWQPEEGRLELDSENTTLAKKGYPTQQFEILNGSLDWKELSDGMRLSLDRFILSQKDLTLSAEGSVDEITKDSLGHVHLTGDFSGKHIEQWMAYLPKKYLKPKLYAWLRNDIKTLEEMNGSFRVNGLAKDFPFDEQTGEFSILSHVTGGVLQINSQWKPITEIDGTLRLDKRNLHVDIRNANFQGAVTKEVLLKIDDIGHDKETLVIEGQLDAGLQKMADYVLTSPLKKPLAFLNNLKLDGNSLLKLQVQVPLYPENDDILAQGQLLLAKNTLWLKTQNNQFPIEDVDGLLYFDEQGLKTTELKALSFGHPLAIQIQSQDKPKRQTDLHFNGLWAIDSLKKYVDAPVLSLMKGDFAIEGVFSLAKSAKEVDELKLHTSLQGLSIDLPAPLGKKRDDTTPLDLNVSLLSEDSIQLKAKYAERLSLDFLFNKNKSGFDFYSGQVSLGEVQAASQNLPGLSIVGSLKGFDLDEWKETFMSRLNQNSQKSSFLNQLKMISIRFDALSFFNQSLNNLKLKAKALPKGGWSIQLSQKNIVASLNYFASTNELSGQIQHLHLNQFDMSDNKTSQQNLRPAQIPNLNLRIDDFSLGAMQLGALTLKSQSTPERWVLNYGRLEAPEYQLDFEGGWTQKGGDNHTKVAMKLAIHDLARALSRWDINPAVDAKKGILQFQGGWPHDIAHFSLKSLYGDLFIQLKTGKITHLSQQTEEKLGLGKLLSILSLQTIPRRLQLDFSDLSQGYSFDIFQGNFKVNKGAMNTQDSYLDGPVAYASMKGKLDLVRRVYDLNLKISPHIAASLPLVATIAGGPIAGVAAWVATKIINQSMQKISAYTYKISGPWDKPIVQQVSIVKKKNQHSMVPRHEPRLRLSEE